MELVDFFRVIFRWKWLVLPIVLLVTGYAVMMGLRAQTSYSSEATIVVGLSQLTSSSTSGISVVQNGERIGATYSEVIVSQPVLAGALEKAGLQWSTNTLRSRISTETIKNTPVMKITVVDSDSERVMMLASSVAESFIDYVKNVGSENLKTSKEKLTRELTTIEGQIANATQASPRDEPMIKALQDRRDSAIKEYDNLLLQELGSGDISLVNPADTYQMLGTQVVQKSVIGFVVSLVLAVTAAFMADAATRAVRSSREGLTQD